jgi:hypothetical protein
MKIEVINEWFAKKGCPAGHQTFLFGEPTKSREGAFFDSTIPCPRAPLMGHHFAELESSGQALDQLSMRD